MSTRQVLLWKFEDGPEDAPDEGHPHDVGPAWIDTYHGDDHISSKQVADGAWITRAEAHRLADSGGYELTLDD